MGKNIITTLIVALPLLFGGLIVRNAAQPDTTGAPEKQTVEQVEEAAEKPAATQINISQDGKTVTYIGETGKTALELLREGANVGTEESSFGEFVTTIGELEADADVEYWGFYVGGEYASEGAGTYETTDGEEIKWMLESL